METSVGCVERFWRHHKPNLPNRKVGHHHNLVRFFKKEPTNAPGYSDLAARRRELLVQRLEARKSIGEDRLLGQEGVESAEELQQRVRAAKEQLASTSAIPKSRYDCGYGDEGQSFYEEELRLAWKRR